MTKRIPSEGAAVERRRARRFPVDWDVVVRGKDGLGTIVDESGSLMDLSSRGACLSIPRQLRVGMRLELWIRMPSEPERWMSYAAEIVRLDQGRGQVGTATKFLAARPKLHSTPQTGSAGKLAILQIRTAEDSGES
jgi:PilZ domain